MSIQRWMGKQIVYACYGILLLLFGDKKEWIIDTYKNIDQSHNNYARWNKPGPPQKEHSI